MPSGPTDPSCHFIYPTGNNPTGKPIQTQRAVPTGEQREEALGWRRGAAWSLGRWPHVPRSRNSPDGVCAPCLNADSLGLLLGDSSSIAAGFTGGSRAEPSPASPHHSRQMSSPNPVRTWQCVGRWIVQSLMRLVAVPMHEASLC